MAILAMQRVKKLDSDEEKSLAGLEDHVAKPYTFFLVIANAV